MSTRVSSGHNMANGNGTDTAGGELYKLQARVPASACIEDSSARGMHIPWLNGYLHNRSTAYRPRR